MLTLRRQPHDVDHRLWVVLCDDVAIGAIVQPGGADQWHWSITVQASVRCARNGKAASREGAMAEFRTAWESFGSEIGPDGWERHVAHMTSLMERAKGW
jgi:hypothetical protein